MWIMLNYSKYHMQYAKTIFLKADQVYIDSVSSLVQSIQVVGKISYNIL